MPWDLLDIVALSRLGRLDSHDRVALMQRHADLEGALAAVGAADVGLRAEAERIIRDASDNSVCILPWNDAQYPRSLLEIDAPPILLYVRGQLPMDGPGIAVVGTRTCTAQYGKPVTEKLVGVWTTAGCSIISGLASGIDTLAHESCLHHRGVTIAVIASGIGRITPKAARSLSDRIVENNGAVVSEHPFHVAALPPYFPARNRIIVGLSRAVVVVESKGSGGALITASFARRAGRPLWSVPGSVLSSRSIGTNALIEAGEARMLRTPEEVLDDLGIDPEPERASPLPDELESWGSDVFSLDDVALRWSTTTSDACIRLLQYELDGLVEQLPGAQYRVK